MGGVHHLDSEHVGGTHQGEHRHVQVLPAHVLMRASARCSGLGAAVAPLLAAGYPSMCWPAGAAVRPCGRAAGAPAGPRVLRGRDAGARGREDTPLQPHVDARLGARARQ
jgi:hypothetical protein